jgi:hypothetical protein
VPSAALELARDYQARAEKVPFLAEAIDRGFTLGSNEWAISGRHTATGRPIVANDPHLSLDTPTTFYPIALRGGGIEVLDPGSVIVSVRGVRVGVAGAKGFIGGFAGSSHLPDFGEPSLRRIYAEATAEIYGLDEGLREISTCDVRIALLHYAPTSETLEGEPGGIWAFLGSDRLAAPILEHEPDLALHGHAHAGAYEGRIGSVPVYNVSVPVIRRDFQVFELTASRSTTPIH